MRTGRHLVTLVAVAVVACAGGCASAGTGNTHSVPVPARVRHAEDVLAGIAPNADADTFQLGLAARAEQLIVGCMATGGFTYRPKDPRSLVDVTTDTDFASLDYARTYGFGVTSVPTFTVTGDPNTGYVDSLAPDRSRAYHARLSSCADPADRTAREEAGEVAAGHLYTRTDARVHADARYRDAATVWAHCAAAAGHPTTSRPDLIRSFTTRREQLTTHDPIRPDGSDRPGTDPALRDLRDSERAAAVATFGCSQAMDGVYRDRYQALR